MPKVVINKCIGGFGLSLKAYEFLSERGYAYRDYYPWELGEEYYEELCVYGFVESSIERHNKDLIECVETLGEESFGKYSELQVVEIEGFLYQIEEFAGRETVITPDSQEWIVIGEK